MNICSRSNLILFASLAAMQFSSCKQLKVSSEKNSASESCPKGSIDVSGFCVKDGLVYLLHEVRLADSSAQASSTEIDFGKQTFYKGDRLYAFGRFLFEKSGSGGLQTLGFRMGESPVGSASTQFVGDQDGGIIVSRNGLAHEVVETMDASLSLRSLATPSARSADGGLLVFRASQLSETLSESGKANGSEQHFVSDLIDSDKILVPEIKPSEMATVVSASVADTKPGDIALVRAGVSWEAVSGKATACEGVMVTWHLMAGDKKIMSEGPYLLSASRSLGSASLQYLQRNDEANQPQKFSLAATIDTGGRAERGTCLVKVGEPSTLSVVLFRSTTYMLAEIQNAKYLHHFGTISSAASRFPSNASGPPIETLLQFNWDHFRSDSLLSDVSITLSAEDRVKPTKAYVQLSRAPDSLSSHLGKINLKSPDRPRSLTLLDLAAEKNLNDQTRFYLTAMGFNDDAKPLALEDAQILFLHFRRVSDRL